ncbi:ABC transporter permease [Xylanimonas allomyrinae]|uniref:ABC transporter permease n=1 Tax=Xylanimonas allomyrinae TaxID=2509459 RepID=A0A4P6EI47_9MICO|nr:ABC transporter permease subunit [Xylanimonas allomyrinae]QAY61985.1 ABC transporter permease [Xylanimonas allomyrinae]
MSTVSTAPMFTSPYASTKVTFPRLLRSEWRKLWSLRSTWWVLGVTFVIMVGFALLFSLAFTSFVSGNPEAMAAADEAGGIPPTTFVVAGYSFGALVAASLGAIAITGEYSTGQIRSSLSAAPTRLPVLWAKLTVVAVVTFVVIAVSTAIAYLVTHPILSSHDISVDLSDGEQVRSLLGAPLYATVVALFALAVGALLRNTPGAIVTVVALFFLVPTIIGTIAGATGAAWAEHINKWLPSAAGERIITAFTSGSAPGARAAAPPAPCRCSTRGPASACCAPTR